MARWDIPWRVVREEAARLGLAAAAMPARELPGLGDRLHLRRRAGWECDFEAKDTAARCDPARSLPGARSVITAALPYRTPAWEVVRRPKGARGAVSKYAWGEDYHRVLRARLEELARALEGASPRRAQWRISVDTGPLVDRAFAEASGLGWIGKNGCLFVEPYGSWVFVGLLLTDLAVEPGRPDPEALVSDSRGQGGEAFAECGSCDRCLRACPTGALVAPGVIDANRCLSYITQMKGIIPKSFRRKMGTRIWGCDICQAVCPVNRSAVPSGERVFLPEEDLAFPDLVALLTMGKGMFRRSFGKTAAAWRGVRVLRRNAAIALGNLRDPAAIPFLIPLLRDPHPEIRSAAAWALGEIGGEEARCAVAEAFARESDPAVREDMEWASPAEGVPAKPL